MKRKTLELEVAQVSAEQRLDDAASKLEGRVHVLQVDKDKWLQAEAAMARLELALQSKDSSIHSELQVRARGGGGGEGEDVDVEERERERESSTDGLTNHAGQL